MKQLTQRLRNGTLSVDKVPLPIIQPGFLLVQSAFSLISAGTERTKIETGHKNLIGKAISRPDQVRQVIQSVQQLGLQSTFQKVKTRLDSRSPLGYSASGIVIGIGPGVRDYKVGDRVACGGATAAHAEVITVPSNLCVHVPDEVILEAAAFTTVGAIAIQSIRQSESRLGEVVVIIGLGLLGQLGVQILLASGCTVIGFDLHKERCQLALQWGTAAVVTNEEDLINAVDRATACHGADAVIITAGTSSNRPVELAGELCREKGSVVVVGAVGLTLPREPYYHKELNFMISRSYGPGRYDPTYEEKGIDYPYGYVRWTEQRNMGAFLSLIASGKVNVIPLITHRFKIDQANEAYRLISGQRQESYLGVLFEHDQISEPDLNSKPMITNLVHKEILGKLGVGVIGAGNFAQSMLLPYLKTDPAVELKSVATLSPLESRDVAERFGFHSAVSNMNDILEDSQIGAVLIASRHDSHADLVIQSLQAGKAVHVEKPLALTQTELDEICKIYYEILNSQHGIPYLQVGFNRRFAPMIQRAANFFSGRSEPLAINYRINAGFISADHWTQDPQKGGGRVVGEVCHFIDLLQFFAKSSAIQVFAQALPNLGKYQNDNIAITVNLADDSIGTILYIANGDKALPKEHLEIFGEGKVAVLDDYRSLALYRGGKQSISREGARDKGHRAEMKAWVKTIVAGQGEPVPFSDSVFATRASFAVINSIIEGQPISLV